MPRYLLDTNIVSFLLRNSHPSLERRFSQTERHEIVLSSVVEGELRYGAARMAANARLHSLLDDFLIRVDVMPWDSGCAEVYAHLRAARERAGKPMGFADTMIAAHALAHDLTLVTNDRDFEDVHKLKLQDWTKGPQRA